MSEMINDAYQKCQAKKLPEINKPNRKIRLSQYD